MNHPDADKTGGTRIKENALGTNTFIEHYNEIEIGQKDSPRLGQQSKRKFI
jgi:hypothetical protein